MYIRSNTVSASSQGASFYTAPNPAYGATMVYYLKESPKTLRQKRVEAERNAERQKQPFRYPSIEELRNETEEEAPALLFTITDSGWSRRAPFELCLRRKAFSAPFGICATRRQ